MICQEEMEQVHEARALVQAKAWEEVRAPAAVGAVVLRQARADIVCVQTVGKRFLINWDPPVMSTNVQSAGWL